MGVGSFLKVGGKKPKIILLLVVKSGWAHVPFSINIKEKSGWARAHPAYPAPMPLKPLEYWHAFERSV